MLIGMIALVQRLLVWFYVDGFGLWVTRRATDFIGLHGEDAASPLLAFRVNFFAPRSAAIASTISIENFRLGQFGIFRRIDQREPLARYPLARRPISQDL